MPPPANQELANTPTRPRDDTTMDLHLPNPSSNGPRCESENPENFEVHFKGIENKLRNVEVHFEGFENEFKIFSSEFSDFHMEYATTNIKQTWIPCRMHNSC